jgi:hypothetical protein
MAQPLLLVTIAALIQSNLLSYHLFYRLEALSYVRLGFRGTRIKVVFLVYTEVYIMYFKCDMCYASFDTQVKLSMNLEHTK